MLKRLLIIYTLLNMSVVFAANNKTPYAQEIGERVFATASSLSLKENRLYACYEYVYFDYYYLSTPENCNSNENLHSNCHRKNANCYTGWVGELKQNTRYFANKWFSYIVKYPGLGTIIVTIDEKFTDIFNRLHTAQQNRKRLEDTFSEYQGDGVNYSQYIGEVDSDIELLSSHGMALAKVTKRLINTIKPIVIDAEMRMATISGRKRTMKGLRSFEKEMNQINRLPQTAIDDSIQKIIESIDSAIDDLERTLAR